MTNIPTYQQVQQILDHHQALLSRPEVVSLAVRATPTPTLVVGVVSQPTSPPVPSSVSAQVSDRDGRPATVELATEIFVEGEITTQMTQQPVQPAPQPPQRPALGGWPIRASHLGYGTLGVNIQYNGSYQLLSCAHVLTQYDLSRTGVMIYQPAVMNPANNLVPVTWQQQVQYYNTPTQPNPVENVRDIATAAITQQDGSPDIELIDPPPAGVRAPNPSTDTSVMMYGAVSGIKNFQVVQFGVRYRSKTVDSSGNTIYSWWRDGMRYSAFMGTNGGDSGAALVSDHDQYVIGLHRCANGTGSAYGCPIA